MLFDKVELNKELPPDTHKSAMSHQCSGGTANRRGPSVAGGMGFGHLVNFINWFRRYKMAVEVCKANFTLQITTMNLISCNYAKDRRYWKSTNKKNGIIESFHGQTEFKILHTGHPMFFI